jgi:ubiquinone/menaquinone biosynthesis C-methylase UbiE
MPNPDRPDYGIDAPNVIRNLFLAGIIGVSAWALTTLAALSGRIPVPKAILVITGMGFTTGVGCILMAVWMLWHSKVGKLRSRERLLDRIPWSGEEQVLDVGCGRGLLLNGAAKRLKTGRATGIDIWQTEDLTGNGPEAALENARRERVAERVVVQTADMRKLPFSNDTFDVVVSNAAIHNLYKADDRADAIREIARVMKPGACAVIEDIRHHRQYTLTFSQNGCTDIRRVGSVVLAAFLMLITFGSLNPATLVVRKTAK